MTLILLAVVLFALITLVGYLMMRFVTHPNRPDFEETRRLEIAQNYWGNYDSFPKETWDIQSYDGTILHGTYIPNNSDKYVIFTHGYSYNRHGAVKYANIFYELGFNIYLYDLRYHGDNEHQKNYCTMGDAESQDLSAVIDAMKERFGQDIFLGIHGESLGAASSILVLKNHQDLSFCIADCPFCDLRTLLYYQAKQMFHMPKFMVHVANICYRILKGRNFFQISPLDAVRKNQVPLLLIHGEDDDFIPPEHSERLFAACPSTTIKEIHMMPGAKHAGSYGANPTLYKEWVEHFLQRI
ncbi:MAG: alpha/beta hydrolase [Lachnospiraceae bacterium]|nr:alpha/beta hydrolase [Lachnospiraceae bacterium]MDD6192277.1 alpha/beta hydrolase [Lachnospiraceae bacterium]